MQSWSRAGLLDRIFLVLVSDGCVEGARAELRSLGVPTADLENLCLGWLSTRVTGPFSSTCGESLHFDITLPEALNPQPYTLNPEPYSFLPKPSFFWCPYEFCMTE